MTFSMISVLLLCYPRKHGLQAVYYANTDWKGEPALRVLDRDVSNQTLRERGAQLAQEAYSAEWRGWLIVPQTATYTFSTESDDGSWLFIDDILVVDNGGVHGLKTEWGQIHLRKGAHPIRIRYLQIGGYAVLRLLWQNEASPKTVVSAHLFAPTDITTRLWLYHTAQTIFPWLAGVWALFALEFVAASTLLSVPNQELTTVRATCDALGLHPLRVVREQLRQSAVRYWMLTTVYIAIIFLTLSYARTLSNVLTQRWGDDFFSTFTNAALSLAGILIVGYFVRSRHHLFSRLLAMVAIGLVYVYFLSSDVREMVHAWHAVLGRLGEHLATWGMFPITPAEKVHFLEYGLLGLLLCKALSYHIQNKLAYLVALLGVYLVGSMDEGIQWALPNRVGDYRDIWLNLLAGGLAIVLVWLVIRPRIFQRTFEWSALRPVCAMLSLALLLTGIFLQVVNGFGRWIFLPDSATRFVSAFSEYDLLRLDKQYLERLEGKAVEEIPAIPRQVLEYEANRHEYYRNWYYKHQEFFESYCEQEILKTYFRAYLTQHQVQLYEYDFDLFSINPIPDRQVFYESRAQALTITGFTAKTMWGWIITMSAALLFVLTFIPDSSVVSARRFERFVLRPAAGLTVLVACGLPFYFNRPTPPKPYVNVLILTVDSCQPDYWSAYGYPKRTTPFFDALTHEGVLFDKAIVPASWTIPSLASLLTGVNPNVHSIDARGKIMDRRLPTLFEILEQHGYAIGDTSYTLTEPSINSVFKKTDISPDVALSEGRSEESYLLSWMEEHRNQPFFGWVHFHTSHLPYQAKPPYNTMFLEDVNPEVLHDEQIRFVLSNVIVRKGEVQFDPQRHASAVRALYTQTLRQQDAKIGKVLQKLDELGLRESTLIVITADHGDELLEHGFVGHASTSWDSTVYDDLVNVPLLIVAPQRLPPGKRIETQVRTIDVMPTILDLVEIPFSGQIQGKSLLPLMQHNAPFEETAFSETTPCGYSCPQRLAQNWLRSVRTNTWKYITAYDDASGQTREELYNLQADPAEQQNVLTDHPAIVAQFKTEMQRWMDAPAQFPYQVEQSTTEHYLDVDVEVRPIVLVPTVGTVVSPETNAQRIHLQWTGETNAAYEIEYDVGQGGYHMTGKLDVMGTEQWYGPFPEDIWQALPLYNPWKFRVIPKKYPEFPSDWITFTMRYK